MLSDFLANLLGVTPASISATPTRRSPARRATRPPTTTSIRCPDMLALVSFGTEASVLSTFVPVHDGNFAAAVKRLPGQVGGTTNMAAGISRSLDLLAAMPTGLRKRIWLLTDGHATCAESAVLAAAQRARRLRVNINCVGIGRAADFDGPLLRKVCGLTHRGRFFHCGDLAQLDRAFRSSGPEGRSGTHVGEATAFAIDVSGSMATDFGRQTRIEAVRDAMWRLLRYKQQAWN